MVWHGKGKFGIHSGRTLRSHPTKSYYCAPGFTHANQYRHEYAVVKELKFYDPTRRLSFNKDSVKLSVNDGELPLENGAVIYSMNKRKRWLLPDLVKDEIEETYWENVHESEQHSELTKRSCKKAKEENNQVKQEKLRVTVVERHAAKNIDRRTPDCIGVTSSRPCLNSSEPRRKPRKNHAHVADLKTKLSDDDDGVEVYYEFLSPFPKKCWPLNRQHGRLQKRFRYEVQGKKSRKKCKNWRNKRRERIENDGDSLSNSVCDEVIEVDKECGTYLDSTCLFPLGTYIDDMLATGDKKENNSGVSTNTIREAPSTPVLYGKGDAIYVEQESQHDGIHGDLDSQAVTQTKPLIVDKKLKFCLLQEDISPDNLLQQFGSNYVEDGVSPRKFIIKADMNETVPNVCTDLEACDMLFEVADTLSSVVEADVAVCVAPNNHGDIMPHNLLQRLQSYLDDLSHDTAPLAIKTLVDQTTQKILSEFVCIPRNSCSRKGDVSVAKDPVNFIHNVCAKEATIYDIRDASRYSMNEAGESDCHLPSSGNMCDDQTNDVSDEFCCEICYVKEDVEQETDFTTLLQCGHRFCNHCWTAYVISRLDLGQSRITCPRFKCKTAIGEAVVWSLTNSEVYRRYVKLKHQLVIDTNQQFRHCPAADCNHMAYVNSSESSLALPILCNCGLVWCFGCQKDAHWPASCEEAELFRKKWDDHENLRKIYHLPGRISSVQVKRCPFCSHPIDKGMGCQHMSCRCGNEFCWECLSPWEGHNWDTCDDRRKDLEDVQLALDFGSARFNKYSTIALENFLERSGKRLGVFRRQTKRAKQLNDVNKFVSFDLETSTNRRLRRYAERNLGTFLEEIFNFKYLAHLVLENTAAVLAITQTKSMLKTIDKIIQMLSFIVQRLNEVFSKPEVLTDEKILKNLKLLLLQGKQLIRNIHTYTRARRNNKLDKFVHKI